MSDILINIMDKHNEKTILVTGCAGFIGNNFIHQFKEKFPGSVIVGIDNFSTGRRDADLTGVVLYEGSILDNKLIKEVFSEHHPDYVFHFAALPSVTYSVEHPGETTAVNTQGTVILLEAARDYGVKRFIFSSSAAIYGTVTELPVTEDRHNPHPETPYAAQKYTSEVFCRMFSELYGLETVCLRYFNAFGPGQYGGSAYATVISAWLEGVYFPKDKTPFIEGDGTQTRDFCYVDNIVQANILAMQTESTMSGQGINIANGESVNLVQVRQLIEEMTKKDLVLEQRPPRLGDIQDSCADISRAKQLLNYIPATSFERGLESTIAWFDQRKQAS